MNKAVEILVFLSTNIGFMQWVQAVTREKYDEWHHGVSASEWLGTFGIPLILLALVNIAIYFAFRERRN